VKGIETWYYLAEKKAQIFQNNLIKYTKTKSRGIKKGNFYVLRKTKMPAVLVEIGFLTNLTERNKLIKPDYQWKIVNALQESIRKCL